MLLNRYLCAQMCGDEDHFRLLATQLDATAMQHLFQGATVFKLCQHACAPPPHQEAHPSAHWQTSAQTG